MIDLSNISLQFSGRYLYRDINYRINAGDKISLVGANGTGKTSLLKIISGEIQPEKGNVYKQKGINVGYLPQENINHKGKKLFDEAYSALSDIISLKEKEKILSEKLLSQNLSDDEKKDFVNQLGEVHHRLEELDSYSAESRVKKILIGLGFTEVDFDKLTDEFSGGWQMRIALAKILITQNDILLLDEPTNHLDLDSLEWLINFLKNYKGAILVVSHDKHFVDEITDKTLEIFLSKFNTFNGNYEAYLKYKEARDTQLVEQFEQQQKKIKETEKFIERFRYKATKAKQVQSRIKQLEKIELVQLPEETGNIKLKFPEPPHSGIINIELINLSKSYGNNNVLSDINFSIERGDKIAFVGPNGAGKSTLAKIIAGKIPFNSGERKIGYNTIINYYAQDVADDLNPDLDLIETLEETASDKTPVYLRNLLGSFLFSGDDVFKNVGVLSGGEKSRVALSKILLTQSNLIILDEPTNHLDYSSKNILQSALINFSGSLVLVSHDIDFLRPIVNKVVYIKNKEIKIFPDGIDYFLLKRIELQEQEEVNKSVENNSQTLSRKEQKRIEAELRQKKYQATKDLVKNVERLELKISELEKREKHLEKELSDPELYKTPELMKKKNLEFTSVKKELSQLLVEWETKTAELQKSEERFS
ncbi:MAG TPA: ABC-F family ATP-binding cassette domain-containing protein [Ignavibacteriaceae bacterium]|nr:ABC-F family ATP-binding cassette domain-containing protein [Ignavibacteriaceae bacterium]